MSENKYSELTDEDFDRILGEVVKENAGSLLTIPEAYNVLSEHFNNEVLERWENEHPGLSSWDIWSYDVWGNEEEGYQVNDRSRLDTITTLTNEITDGRLEQIIQDYFGDPDKIQVDNGCSDDEHIYLVLTDDEVTDYPIGEIIKVD